MIDRETIDELLPLIITSSPYMSAYNDYKELAQIMIPTENTIGKRLRARLKGPVTPRTTPKIGRNEPCTCGSGKKYKNCCINESNK